MLSELNAHGYLPPGVHTTTLDEFQQRFGFSAGRQTLLQNLQELINIASRAGALRIFIDGSFVTDKENPGDIDAILVVSDDFDAYTQEAQILAQAKTRFNIHLFIERAQNQERIHLWLVHHGVNS